jgi:hypothetical protein
MSCFASSSNGGRHTNKNNSSRGIAANVAKLLWEKVARQQQSRRGGHHDGFASRPSVRECSHGIVRLVEAIELRPTNNSSLAVALNPH